MANYYTFWINEGTLITILQALKPLDKEIRIVIIDKIIDHIVNREIADTIAYDNYNPYDDYVPDDYDHIYHGYADYSDSYNTD